VISPGDTMKMLTKLSPNLGTKWYLGWGHDAKEWARNWAGNTPVELNFSFVEKVNVGGVGKVEYEVDFGATF